MGTGMGNVIGGEIQVQKMGKFVVKRLLLSVLILFCATFVIYAVLRSLPGNYVRTMAIQLASKPGAKSYEEWMAQLSVTYGLDKGIVPGYFVQMWNMLQGNFGDSWRWTALS